jgi:hypothetical protein
MNILARGLVVVLICLPFSVFAQYTETINSNRPGNSQGAFAVGYNVLQLELGLGYGKEKHELLFTDANAFSVEYAARYGLLMERLEINAIGSYQSNNVTFDNSIVSGTFKQSNFKLNSIGAKYLLYDPYRKRELEKPNLYSYHANFKFRWRELIPAVAVYAAANFDSEDNPFSPEFEATISPRFGVITQNNFNGGWVFVTNFLVERITTDFPSYSYLLTLTHAFNPKFSMFLENEGIFSDFYADQLFRGGAAYLLNTEFSLDASILLNWKDTPSRTFFKLGASYRFDMHKKDEVIEEKGNKDSKPKKQRKRKDDVEVDDGGF